MQHIDAPQLAEWLDDARQGGVARPLLLDVREAWEFDTCRIDGALPMPMRSVPARYAELDRHAPTVVICHHGQRSQQVAMFLERQGFDRVINLTGGVAAWARQVAPDMPNY